MTSSSTATVIGFLMVSTTRSAVRLIIRTTKGSRNPRRISARLRNAATTAITTNPPTIHSEMTRTEWFSATGIALILPVPASTAAARSHYTCPGSRGRHQSGAEQDQPADPPGIPGSGRRGCGFGGRGAGGGGGGPPGGRAPPPPPRPRVRGGGPPARRGRRTPPPLLPGGA